MELRPQCDTIDGKLDSRGSSSNKSGSKGLSEEDKKKIMETTWKPIRPYKTGKNATQLRKEIPRVDIGKMKNCKALNND